MPKSLRVPYRYTPRNYPKRPYQPPRYIPEPPPDLTPKGNWWSRFLKDLADFFGGGIGGAGGVSTDPCGNSYKFET